MAAAVLQPEKPYVDAVLNYRLDPTMGGTEVIWGGVYGQLRRKYHPFPVKIYDERGHEDQFKIDVQGFQLEHAPAPGLELNEDGVVPLRGSAYDEDCVKLLKKVTGCSRVFVISSLTRRRGYDATKASGEDEDKPDMEMTPGNASARFVHVDQSYSGARKRLYLDMGAEEAKVMEKTRWSVINIWRPLEVVNNEPLGLCDARTVSEEQLHDTIHLVPVKWPMTPPENKMWQVGPPEKEGEHKWHFFSKMTPDECLVMKMFDSKKEGVCRRLPHSAFPTPEDFGPPRRSVETRCFCFWEDESAD
ncbi:hypothetical protein M409DRAFT_16619 [Zasmidium cellare ATCC 36951]|uniref:Methyltransferase n=1 Tax=Zasmidium cellare ATCC 36951 TaxID=1080233 RepID=A0A6A6CZJ2_ZASCE|nr:uncharacterized protein M409DRAFT_16619 [Zasmidium cellare ATCC 36951]KAF2172657.1 hypothetical protein M409DRAFT_16619 [Zasmidium cellare ATCC 36951]